MEPKATSLFRVADCKVKAATTSAGRGFHVVGRQVKKTEDINEFWISKDDSCLRKAKKYITISEHIHQEAIEFIKTKDPTLYEELQSKTFTEQRYVQETRYDDVYFDQDIEKEVFYPK